MKLCWAYGINKNSCISLQITKCFFNLILSVIYPTLDIGNLEQMEEMSCLSEGIGGIDYQVRTCS